MALYFFGKSRSFGGQRCTGSILTSDCMHPIGPSHAYGRIFIFFFGLHHFAAMHPSFSKRWVLIWFLRARHLVSHGPLFSTQWPIIFETAAPGNLMMRESHLVTKAFAGARSAETVLC